MPNLKYGNNKAVIITFFGSFFYSVLSYPFLFSSFFLFFHSFLNSEARFFFYPVLIYKELTVNHKCQQLKILESIYTTLHFMSISILAIGVVSVVK